MVLLRTVSATGDCRTATITISPQSITLLPSQYSTGGTANITCHTSGLQTGDVLIAMNIIRTVGSTDTYLASASKVDTHAFVEPASGLTRASVTGGITKDFSGSSMTLTLTQARCDQDEGMYTCKITILRDNTIHRAYDHKNLSIQGEALTLQTLKQTCQDARCQNGIEVKLHQRMHAHAQTHTSKHNIFKVIALLT